MKVFISGPIEGESGTNVEAMFEDAEKMLIGQGHEVINPFKICEFMRAKEWNQHLKDSVEQLVRCDAIFFLPGWRRSKVSIVEHYVAHNIGLIIQK